MPLWPPLGTSAASLQQEVVIGKYYFLLFACLLAHTVFVGPRVFIYALPFLQEPTPPCVQHHGEGLLQQQQQALQQPSGSGGGEEKEEIGGKVIFGSVASRLHLKR